MRDVKRMNEAEMNKLKAKLAGEAVYLIKYFERQKLTMKESLILLSTLLGALLSHELVTDEEAIDELNELKKIVYNMRKSKEKT